MHVFGLSVRFPAFTYRAKLRRLVRAEKRDRRVYTAKLKAARAAKDRTTEDELPWEWRTADDMTEAEVSSLQTETLRTKARQYPIPIQEFSRESGDWTENAYGSWVLSTKARHELRAAIRREQKERRDMWMPWVPPAVSIAAAIVSGFFALWGE